MLSDLSNTHVAAIPHKNNIIVCTSFKSIDARGQCYVDDYIIRDIVTILKLQQLIMFCRASFGAGRPPTRPMSKKKASGCLESIS